MNNSLVSRDFLRRWGFIRLPDAWLYSSCSKRREYFETWFQSEWNYRVHPGLPGADPLQLTEQEFLQRLSDHLASEFPLQFAEQREDRVASSAAPECHDRQPAA